MKVDVYNSKGSKTDKSVTLNKAVFGIEPNDHAIYLDVKRFQAAQRQGTHDTLHRGLVSGSTRKLKKQKGTGTARAGSIKNPLFRGGGTVLILQVSVFGAILRDLREVPTFGEAHGMMIFR